MTEAINTPSEFMPGASMSINTQRLQAQAVHHILTLNGVGQYLTFAKTIVGDGAGKIVLRGKLSDIDETVKLLDGEGLTNRLYVNLNDTNDSLTAGTLTVTVNEIDNSAIYNELIEIVVEGDFTGLELATVFARFNGTECAKFQPFYISWADDSQAFEYDFTKAVAGYFLPEGFEFERNIVLQNHVATLDGTEADWYSISLGLGASVMAGQAVFYRVSISDYVSGKIKPNSEVDDGPWLSANGVYEGILSDAGTYVSMQSAAGADRFIGTIKSEIYFVPNALILQGASADINDDFEPMVQQPTGEWVGVKNYFVPSSVNVTWDQEGKVFTKNSSAWGGMGELLGADTIDSGDWRVYVKHDGPTVNLGIYTRNEAGTGNTPRGLVTGNQSYDIYVPTGGLWFDSSIAPGESISGIKFNRLIKLSDYLLKQYQIEQTEAAIAAYQAKNKTRNITTTDGVDDYVSLNIVLSGDFDISIRSLTPDDSSWDTLLGFESARFTRSSSSASTHIYLNVVNAPTQVFAPYELGVVAEYGLRRRGETVYMLLDGEVVSFISNSAYLGDWEIQTVNKDESGIGGPDHSEGFSFDLIVVDHENPLPIGQGGNSLFLPLDDPKGTIAANKLGVDKKGNIVVKDGAGLGGELISQIQGHAVLAGGATVEGNQVTGTASNSTIRFQFPADMFVIDQWYEVVVAADVVLDAAVDMCDGAVAYVGNGTTTLLLKRESHRADGNTYKFIDFSRIDIGDTVELLSVKPAHGYGEWQGLPADFSTTEEYTRDAEGALLGSDKWNGLSEVPQNIATIIATSIAAELHTIVATNLQAGSDLKVYGASGWVSLAEGVPVEFVAATNSIQVKDFAVSQASAVFEVRRKLPLSAELQRQHDLKIVETKVAKQLKRVAKTVTLSEFDGVDDKATFPEWVANGRFKLGFSFVSTQSGTVVVLGSSVDYSNHLFVGPTQIQLRIGTTRMYFDGSFNDGLYHTGLFVREADGTVTLRIDGGTQIVENTGVKVTHPLVLDSMATEAGITPSEYVAAYAMLIDEEDPKNSRFYVHNPAGYLEDKLHADGSMNGAYSGMPVDFSNIQSFKKSGDDWVSVDQLTTIPGA